MKLPKELGANLDDEGQRREEEGEEERGRREERGGRREEKGERRKGEEGRTTHSGEGCRLFGAQAEHGELGFDGSDVPDLRGSKRKRTRRGGEEEEGERMGGEEK